MVSTPPPVLPPINSPPPIDIPELGSLPPSTESASAKDTPRPLRPAPSNVFARLQALFPHPHPSSEHSYGPILSPPLPPLESLPKFIKVRILTWNMHDSLPKGDLEDLLGTITAPDSSTPRPNGLPTLPMFPNSPDHPYHLVVVAGQECPSASGLPMALGAGFKLNNKDNSRSRHSLLPQDLDESAHRKSAETDLLSPSVDKSHDHHPPSSWSTILENWYCHSSTHPTDCSASDPNLRTQHEIQRVGPYELLVKERMMGLYLAVFIYHDARPFVRGTSKSAVTTGLIGGRVGNKGGVGVSVNLDGHTLLFINAHLAAHESKKHHRLADLAKIKAELTVDDFLSPNDPRFMAEDITDRFDTTFICGDLNFRLDITRLHADWLISRKEYEQALEFDQLRKVMAVGDAFEGFSEGAIRFPPTFKYDVLRTIKKSRHRSFKHSPGPSAITTPTHEQHLTEVAQQEQEHGIPLDNQQDYERNEDDTEQDGVSVSSAWTSVRSRRTGEPELDADEPEPVSGGYFVQSPPAGASTTNLMHTAAHKAKEKWVALFLPSSPKSPAPWNKRRKWRQSWSLKQSPGPERRGSHPTPIPQMPVDPANPDAARAGRAREFQAALLDAVHARPHMHLALSESNVDLGFEEDKGVYDSSHKQRVPSWCDRILWKSTIVTEQESDDPDSQRFIPLRAKMGQIFNALRPSSLRSRRDSTWSVHHPDVSRQATLVNEKPRRTLVQPAPEKCRLSTPTFPVSSPTQAKAHSLPRLSQMHSAESLQTAHQEPSLTRINSHVSAPSQAAPGERVPMRHANTIATVMPVGETVTASSTLVSSPVPSSPLEMTAQASVSPSAPVFKWLLPFLYRDGAHQPNSPSSDPLVAGTLQSQTPPPRRGDVVCLKYDTLGDRGMRRLEGRSDHRPVIGAYVLYT